MERSGDRFFLQVGRKAINLSEFSYFLTKYLNTEQFVSFGVKEGQSGDIYFEFKNSGISMYF